MDFNKRIIKEVKKHDSLYNVRSKWYKNKTYREILWTKIGKCLDIPAEEVKKKWRNIRDAYKKNRNIITAKRKGVFRRPYKYAELLSFLDDMPQRIMNTYNISESSVDITSDSGSDQELEYIPPTKLSKIKVEKEECLTQCVNAPSTVCVEDTSQSEFMNAPSSSTYLGEAEDSRRTNDEQTDVPSSSIRVVENSARSIAKPSITEQLFRCLAKKVIEANLTAQQINDIEHSVCLLVYSRLANYNRDSDNLTGN